MSQSNKPPLDILGVGLLRTALSEWVTIYAVRGKADDAPVNEILTAIETGDRDKLIALAAAQMGVTVESFKP